MVSAAKRIRVAARRQWRALGQRAGFNTLKPLARKIDREQRQLVKVVWAELEKGERKGLWDVNVTKRPGLTAAMASLAESPHASARKPLLEVLSTHGESQFRLDAARALRDRHGVDVDTLLFDRVEAPLPFATSEHMMHTYADLHGRDAVPKLLEWAQRSDRRDGVIQGEATELLGKIGDVRALPILAQALTHRIEHIRETAAKALVGIVHPDALSLALRFSRDAKSPNVRVAGQRTAKHLAYKLFRSKTWMDHPKIERARSVTELLAGSTGQRRVTDRVHAAALDAVVHSPYALDGNATQRLQAIIERFYVSQNALTEDSDVICAGIAAALNPHHAASFRSRQSIDLFLRQLRTTRPEQVK